MAATDKGFQNLNYSSCSKVLKTFSMIIKEFLECLHICREVFLHSMRFVRNVINFYLKSIFVFSPEREKCLQDACVTIGSSYLIGWGSVD